MNKQEKKKKKPSKWAKKYQLATTNKDIRN